MAARKRTRTRGQAMVEFAILIPFLFTIVMGSVDFGRVFGQNAAILGAAREAVRQAISYSSATGTNPYFGSTHDADVLAFAHDELGLPSSDTTTLTLAPHGHENDCYTPTTPPPTSLYPATSDTGYVFVCWTNASLTQPANVTVTIAWTMSLITPFVQSVVGTPHLHAIIQGTEQSP